MSETPLPNPNPNPNPNPIFHGNFEKEYQLREEIGRGRFGVVHRCFSPSARASFAVKSIDKRDDPRCLDKLLLLLPPHPNLLSIHNLYESDSHLLIVTDLCGPDLFDLLHPAASFSEADARSVLSQLVSALAHCHRHGVAHRDVKPENVLFDSLGRLRLCDFGLADKFSRKAPLCGKAGTPPYVAPEVLSGRNYDEKVDVWSAGVVLYRMLGGVAPFHGESPLERCRAVMKANLTFPAREFRSVSPQAIDLIRKMLCKDAAGRPTAEQVLRHPWVARGGNARPIRIRLR